MPALHPLSSLISCPLHTVPTLLLQICLFVHENKLDIAQTSCLNWLLRQFICDELGVGGVFKDPPTPHSRGRQAAKQLT